MRIRLELLISILCLSLFSCKENPQKKYEKAVMELSGKTIIFPDSMHSIFGEKIPTPSSEFTIVAYFDSVGCTSCRMKLAEWTRFMKMTDSIMGGNRVSLLLITGSHNLANVRQLVRKYEFRYPVVNDSAGSFARLNSIPDDTRLQSFLLDSDHRIYLIGNPTNSKEMRELYLDQLALLSSDSYDTEEEHIEEFDFGSVKINEPARHDFRLKNIYPDTLYIKEIISSCECTSAEVSAREIAPGEQYHVIVTFHDSVPGEFIRSVTLRYQDTIPVQILEISGNIRQ